MKYRSTIQLPASAAHVHVAITPVALDARVADTGNMTLLERESSLASPAEYAREARQGEGRLVLGGLCDGLFTPRPLGPLFDLADQLGGELLDLCRAGAPREQLFGALLRQVSEPTRSSAWSWPASS
jgi:hypothetical protein